MVEGRNVIVTGAGNGLGLAIARRFVELGAKAVLVDRDEAVLARIGSEELPPDRAPRFMSPTAPRIGLRWFGFPLQAVLKFA